MRPLSRLLVEKLPLIYILLSDHSILRTVGLGVIQQHLQAKQGSPYTERWTPLIFEDVQADDSCFGGNVGVSYFREELHLGGHEGVLLRDDNVDEEEPAFVDGVGRASDDGSLVVNGVVLPQLDLGLVFVHSVFFLLVFDFFEFFL